MHSSSARVLTVDDDTTFQRLVAVSLSRVGCEVVSALDGIEGCSTIEREGSESFDCVLIDHHMPRMDGFTFLDWLRKRDTTLAVIVITAGGNKKQVEQTLRAGASNFLDKPVRLPELREAVTKAVELTRSLRTVAHLREDVGKVGRLLRTRLTHQLAESGPIADYYYLPKYEAGGDFLRKIQLNEDQDLILMTDVSGHDLQSAQYSHYFYGFLESMLICGKGVLEVLTRFNEYTVDMRTAGQASDDPSEVMSIALSALLIDRRSSTMTLLSAGAPPPLWMHRGSLFQAFEDVSAPPLGWFKEERPLAVTVPLPDASVYIWTDGLDDLSVQLNASPLSIGYALTAAKKAGITPPWLNQANDDLLLARICPRTEPPEKPDPCIPLYRQTYGPEHADNIDEIQQTVSNSFRIALPTLDESACAVILLCIREGLLNAIRHGCKHGEKALLEAFYDKQQNKIRIHLSDPGCGHSFSTEQRRDQDAMELADNHRGLMLIYGFADSVHTERNGADLQMEFLVN